MAFARVFIVAACASICAAQPAPSLPAAPPKVLLLARQQFKPAKARARERLARAISAACNRLELPVHWMDLEAFSGSPETLFFDPFDSFEALEKAGAVFGPLYEAQPELARLKAGLDDALSSQRTILAVRRDSPGVDDVNLAQARFLRMLVVRTQPGEQPPAWDGGPASSVVYEVKSGMAGPAFLIFQALPAFTELPSPHISPGTIVEDAVYAVDPEMSHVSHAFAEQNSTFWMKPAGQ